MGVEGARPAPGDVLVDVGCGDGMIGLRALERHTESRVIFVDVSPRLLDQARDECLRRDVIDRATFITADARNLVGLPDACADAVLTRSVLIYVEERLRTVIAAHRILRPGGRLSCWEPVNSWGFPPPPDELFGFRVTSAAELAEKVQGVYARQQQPAGNPMLTFDERRLFADAEQASFKDVQVLLELRRQRAEPRRWEIFVRSSPNPLAPTLAEAMTTALTEKEVSTLTRVMRPLVETGEGSELRAAARLTALK